jgi:CubicO group peptidase (beta-lactamase class C family)
MNDSTLLVKQADPTLLAWGHELGEDGRPFPSAVYPYNRIHTPSSNLHSNVLDMARWALANMNRGGLDGKRILKDSTYDVMWKPAAEFDGRPSPTGISWFVSEYRGIRLIGHGGGDTGFRTGLALLPEEKIAVVWMTNAEWLPSTAAVTHAALDAALGLIPRPIDGKRSIGEAMLSTYVARGVDAAVRQYETIKERRPEFYDFGVAQLNGVGRYVLGIGHVKDAIRLFEMNVAAYPTSADAFDALGKAYEKGGNAAAALRSYEKALELSPEQAHAAEGLKRLRK